MPATKIIVEVSNAKKEPVKGVSVSLYNVTDLSGDSLDHAIEVESQKTGDDGRVTLSYTKSKKITHVAVAIVAANGEVLARENRVSEKFKSNTLIKLKLSKAITFNPVGGHDTKDAPDLGLDEIKASEVLAKAKPYSEHILDRIAKKKTVREEIKKAVGKEIKRKRALHGEALVKAREILNRRQPLEGTLDSVHVKDRDPVEVLEGARETGLERLKKLSGKRRGIIVRGRDKDSGKKLVESLEKKKSKPETLNEAMFSSKAPASQRTEQFLQDCYVRSHLDAFEERIGNSQLDEEEGSEETVTAISAITAGGGGTVEESLENLLSQTQNTIVSGRPDVDAVQQNLVDNQLPKSPADTTAYYDFRSLHIAWRDVWDVVFDDGVLRDIAALYDEIVDIVPEEDLIADLSEIDELNSFLNTISATADFAADIIDIPQELLSWLPEVNEVKHFLSAEDLEYLRFLHFTDSLVRSPNFNMVLLPNAGLHFPQEWMPNMSAEEIRRTDWAKSEARTFIEQLAATGRNAGLGRVSKLISSLQRYLVEPYKFDVFVPDSYNFGIVTTYRQKWEPRGFQAGDLVSTLPMAPGEKRSIEIRKLDKTEQSKSDKRFDSTTDTRDMSETSRMTSKIVNNAMMKMNGDANVSYKPVGFEASAAFGFDQSSDSARNKEEFREAIRKSVQEYKDERTVEINTKNTSEYENTSKVDISNPNNELTVTYLFYELQQRFFVTEKLYDVGPVIMVAFEVPKPHEIDEGWLLQHAWVLRKALLDPKLIPVLNALSKSFAGDDVAVEIKKRQWLAQLAVVEELRHAMVGSVDARDAARMSVTGIMESMNDEEEKGTGEKIIDQLSKLSLGARLLDALFGGDKTEMEALSNPDYDAARQALEWMESDLSNADASLRQATTALERATEAYVDAVASRTNRRISVDQLRSHVKQNILYYMQAIWSHENADQRYMRLYDLEIHWPTYDGDATVTTSRMVNNAGGVISNKMPRASIPPVAGIVKMPPAKLDGETRPLYEVADIDRVIGFKGNYAVFALKENNAITDYMMQDFLDTEFGIYDPDPDGEILTADEALDVAHCAWQQPDLTAAEKRQIKNWLTESLSIARRQGEDIVVPTSELFIEALPGKHTLLEDFKLRHREADAQKAAANAKMAELETLRRIKLLQEGDTSDPEIDKSIRIIGDPSKVVVDAE